MKKVIIALCVIFLTACEFEDSLFFSHHIQNTRFTGLMDYKSDVDKDGDGIDDATDIIQSVRAYVATDPIYKSAYYGTGYPDDGYGVCTDVVGFGLLGAGYDLRELVNNHIVNNPHLYNLEVVDKNIDFRRVSNLMIYFRSNHIELTCDVTQLSEWQAGDILVMEDHVGIVSNKKTIMGVPLVIHHTEKDPHIREDNLLQTRDDIVAHFRIS